MKEKENKKRRRGAAAVAVSAAAAAVAAGARFCFPALPLVPLYCLLHSFHSIVPTQGEHLGFNNEMSQLPHSNRSMGPPPSTPLQLPINTLTSIQPDLNDKVSRQAIARMHMVISLMHHYIFIYLIMYQGREHTPVPTGTSEVLSNHWLQNGTPQAPDADALRTFAGTPDSSVYSADHRSGSRVNSPAPSSITSISSSTQKARAPCNSKRQGQEAKPGQLWHYDWGEQLVYTKAKRLYRVSIFKTDAFPSAANRIIQGRKSFDEATRGKS